MGGRGSSYDVNVTSARSLGAVPGEAQSLNVAGMTPMEQGSRFTSKERTLSYIENKKMNYDKEQLQVIDRYGYVTRAFQGDEHSVAIDADTRAYMRGKIVTHNHPSSFGGTFSDADINCLKMGMSELRASAKEGTYSMKATKKAKPDEFYNAYLENAESIQSKMRSIAEKMAKKKWSSRQKYEIENRKAQLQVIHEWYEQNASSYGYQYKFEPRQEKGER